MTTVTHGRNATARQLLRAILVATLSLVGLVALGVQAHGAVPPGLSPVLERSQQNVTADALPTVQIDGVVWTEVTVGNTVFAGGSFANARPAGAAAGTQLTPRANLLSFDITTGVLNTTFAPSLNGQVKALAVSPDGKRLYVGGAFTTANGANRYRIAAYNISTGALDTTWAPALDAAVNSITVTDSAVYVGGNFSTANSQPRAHLAAFDPGTGALLGWAPTSNDIVQAVQITPDHSRVIVGGGFTQINGASAYGLGAVDATNGTLLPWAANQVVKDAGTSAAILSLSTDGTAIYSTAYVYGSSGNFEGVGSYDPDSGNINWLADCHGDTYGAFGMNSIVYVVSHMHDCENIGGFPDTNPRSIWHRATAFTAQATGTVAHNAETGAGYGDFYGQPSPSLINWLPDLDIGTYTGQSQAAWSVSGNTNYIALGGEFPKVNGVAQQGLVRFAVPSQAPKKQGPRVSAADFQRSATPLSATSVRVRWQANWDRDDQNLTYVVKRDGNVVYTTPYTSQSWNRPMIGFTDTGLTPNTSYTYRISAADPDGNIAYADNLTATTPTSGTDPTAGPYPQDVLGAGASDYWRLDRLAGASSDVDLAGFNDLTVNSGVSSTTGAILGDSDTALTFNGSSSSGYAYSSGAAANAPSTFSVGAWFKTTSNSGGKIVGFGSSKTGTSATTDRHIYLDNAGHVYFGVYNNAAFTVNTSGTYRDGNWHQVVGTLSSAGLALYVDGALVGRNTGTTVAQAYTGYWRIGGDNLNSWPNRPKSAYLNGSIDDVAIYPSALSLTQVRQQFLDSGRSGSGYQLPNAAFSWTATDLSANLDASSSNDPDGTITSYAWDFGDGTTGTGVNPTHVYGASGTYTVSLTVTDNNGGQGTVSHALSLLGPNQLPSAAFSSTVTGATASFDSSASNDPDGSIASYAWDFGDGTGDTVANPSHTYTSSGIFHVQLTVTDDRGGTNSVTHDVTVATQPPHAAFTSSTNLMTVSFDGSGSTSLDSTITSYDWDFGDGTAHGSGVTPASHTYSTPGTYQVTLKITDNTSQTDSVTHPVTVTNVIAADSFNRTVSGGWGTADVGGAWSRTGGSANFLVDGSRAQVTLATAAVSPTATLDSVSATDVNMVADVSLNSVPVGDSAYAILVARHSGTGDVRLKLRLMPGGVVHLAWSTVSGSEKVGGEKLISGLTFAAGDTLRVRMRLVGTSLTGTVWNPSTGSEPASPQITGTLGTNSTAVITTAGSVGLYSGLGAAATNAPIAMLYDNLSVTLG
jgi:PKD repeat protein